MQYSPKLKKAMEEIKSIVEKYDVGAIVVLHTPMFSEYLFKVDPSYSVARFENLHGLHGVRVKTNPDDSNEDKIRKIGDTINMFDHFVKTGGNIIMEVIEIQKMLEKFMGGRTPPGSSTTHFEQNN